MLKLDLSYKRIILQKLQKNVKSKTAHLCLRTCFCSKINKKSKNTLKIQKKPKKIFFLKSISNFKISYNQIPSM